MSRTHWFQRHNFLFAIGYRNNKDTGPNDSFLWENPWQKAFRQENTERFLLQLFFFFNKCITEDEEMFFSTAPMRSHESDKQWPVGMPCGPALRILNTPAGRSHQWSLLPPFPQKRTKTSRKERQTGRRLANSMASGCIQHLSKASRKQGTGHKHSSHLLWRPSPSIAVTLSYESRGHRCEGQRTKQIPTAFYPWSQKGTWLLPLGAVSEAMKLGSCNPTQKAEGPSAPPCAGGPPRCRI